MINFNDAKFEKSVGDLIQMPSDNLPEIVFSGRSNVGKSSLINRLLNRKALARVSAKPGKTININLYHLKRCRFVDLPGYCYARVSFNEKKRWSKLVDGYFKSSSNIALVLQIIDFRHTPSEQDFQMIDFLSSSKVSFVVVASKIDKLNKTARFNREKEVLEELKSYENLEKINFSSTTGEGIEKIRNVILSSL